MMKRKRTFPKVFKVANSWRECYVYMDNTLKVPQYTKMVLPVEIRSILDIAAAIHESYHFALRHKTTHRCNDVFYFNKGNYRYSITTAYKYYKNEVDAWTHTLKCIKSKYHKILLEVSASCLVHCPKGQDFTRLLKYIRKAFKRDLNYHGNRINWFINLLTDIKEYPRKNLKLNSKIDHEYGIAISGRREEKINKNIYKELHVYAPKLPRLNFPLKINDTNYHV